MVSRSSRSTRKRSNRSSKRSNRSSKRSNRSSKRSNRSRRNTNLVGGGNYSLRQGQEFASYHKNQHGGGATMVGTSLDQAYSSGLPQELRVSARIDGLDNSFTEAMGQRDPDQVGGRRSKKSKKSRKSGKRKSGKRKSRKSKKSRKSNNYRQSGGMAPVGANTMLLSSSQAARAGTADFSNPLLKA